MFKFILSNHKEEKIKKKFQDIGIKLKEFKKIPKKEWESIYKIIKCLMELYPEIPTGFLNEIIIVSCENEPKYACTKPNNICYAEKNSKLGINLYLNEHIFKASEKLFSLSVDSFDLIFPYTKEMVIAHEYAHIIEFFMCFKRRELLNKTVIKENEYFDIMSDTYDMERICKPIMLKYLEKANIISKDVIVYSFIGEFLGSYASKSYSEAFAEAMAQVYGNINNPLALEIIEEYKTYRQIYY